MTATGGGFSLGISASGGPLCFFFSLSLSLTLSLSLVTYLCSLNSLTNGTFQIIDRKKDLVKLCGGEYVA